MFNINFEDVSGRECPLAANTFYNALHFSKFHIATAKCTKNHDNATIEKNNMTIMHIAAAKADEKYIKYLIDTVGASVEPKDSNNATPLHYAVANANEITTDYLITLDGTNINATDNDKATPLHYAATLPNSKLHTDLVLKKLKIINALLTNKADITIKDKNDNTPFDKYKQLLAQIKTLNNEELYSQAQKISKKLANQADTNDNKHEGNITTSKQKRRTSLQSDNTQQEKKHECSKLDRTRSISKKQFLPYILISSACFLFAGIAAHYTSNLFTKFKPSPLNIAILFSIGISLVFVVITVSKYIAARNLSTPPLNPSKGQNVVKKGKGEPTTSDLTEQPVGPVN